MPNYLITLQTLTNRGFYSIDLTNIIERERERERERENDVGLSMLQAFFN
jgi:hypothetical protein